MTHRCVHIYIRINMPLLVSVSTHSPNKLHKSTGAFACAIKRERRACFLVSNKLRESERNREGERENGQVRATARGRAITAGTNEKSKQIAKE